MGDSFFDEVSIGDSFFAEISCLNLSETKMNTKGRMAFIAAWFILFHPVLRQSKFVPLFWNVAISPFLKEFAIGAKRFSL